MSFQRPLQRRGVARVPADEQDVVRGRVARRELPHLGVQAERRLHLLGEGLQARDLLGDLLGELRAAHLRQVERGRCSATIWVENVYVAATPISGPAWV